MSSKEEQILDLQKTCKRLNKAVTEITTHCANWDAYSRSPTHAVKVIRLIATIAETAINRQ